MGTTKPCEMCGVDWRISGERFCEKCKRVHLDKVKHTFTPLDGCFRKARTADQRQDHGGDGNNPWGDNAVRAMEE